MSSLHAARPWLWAMLFLLWATFLLLNAIGVLHSSRWALAFFAFNFATAGSRLFNA